MGVKDKPFGLEDLKIFLLRGVRDHYIYILNLMDGGDIYQQPYTVIYELCQRYSRGTSWEGKGPRDTLKKINEMCS
jgi:hypothetical protein